MRRFSRLVRANGGANRWHCEGGSGDVVVDVRDRYPLQCSLRLISDGIATLKSDAGKSATYETRDQTIARVLRWHAPPEIFSAGVALAPST